MDIVHAILLGVVEGITEFLPISSTGHLILAGEIFHIPTSAFTTSFDIIIQLGAILAVITLYWKSFLNPEILKRLLVAFIPTGIIGLALYRFVKTYLLGNPHVVVWALLLGGVVLMVFELLHTETPDNTSSLEHVSYTQSAWIGLCQALAIVPGVSRSAATIVGGMMAGIQRKTIAEFSFLLAVPTMLAATSLDLLKNAHAFSIDQSGILILGFSVSFIVALMSIRFLLNFITRHTFIPFGIYRIVAALLFYWFIIA